MKTVILLYPDYMNETGNTVETFVIHVDDEQGLADAATLAKMACQDANNGAPEDADDLAVLAVIEGTPEMEVMM